MAQAFDHQAGLQDCYRPNNPPHPERKQERRKKKKEKKKEREKRKEGRKKPCAHANYMATTKTPMWHFKPAAWPKIMTFD